MVTLHRNSNPMQPFVLNLKIHSNSWSRLKPRPGIAENFSIPDIRLHMIIIILVPGET